MTTTAAPVKKEQPNGASTENKLHKLSADTNALNWFEIPVTDADRAKKFYETILDIEMVKPTAEDGVDEMVLFPRHPNTIMGISGIVSGALVKSKRLKTSNNGILIYLNASPSIKTVIDKIEKAGGEIVMPRTKNPAGYIAIFTDTEGNTVGLHAVN
jgi:uncharacterized protein